MDAACSGAAPREAGRLPTRSLILADGVKGRVAGCFGMHTTWSRRGASCARIVPAGLARSYPKPAGARNRGAARPLAAQAGALRAGA
jgi:hypothetical protein